MLYVELCNIIHAHHNTFQTAILQRLACLYLFFLYSWLVSQTHWIHSCLQGFTLVDSSICNAFTPKFQCRCSSFIICLFSNVSLSEINFLITLCIFVPFLLPLSIISYLLLYFIFLHNTSKSLELYGLLLFLNIHSLSIIFSTSPKKGKGLFLYRLPLYYQHQQQYLEQINDK